MRTFRYLGFLIVALLLTASQPAVQAAALIAAEAFLDDLQLVPGTGTPLKLAGDPAETFRRAAGALNLTGIQPGPHTVYLRFQDATGEWSAPLGQSFRVTEGNPSGSGGGNLIVAAEAYIDTDPGKGNGVALDVARDGAIDSAAEILGGAVPLAGLSTGPHVLHVRMLDATGVWSATNRQSFHLAVAGGGSGNPVTLVAAEGIIDEGSSISLTADDGRFDDQLETVTLSKFVGDGYHSARIRFQDSDGLWSDADGSCTGTDILSGRLIDATTGKPLANIVIRVDGKTVQTDTDGYYLIDNLPCGLHEVYVSIGGYETYHRTFSGDAGGWLNIRLTKESTTNGVAPNTGIYGDPVNTATGNYIYQRRDLELPGIGMPLRFDRAYNSREASRAGAAGAPVGYGWSHSYQVRLAVAAGGIVTLTWGDGRTETYAPDGIGGYTRQYGVFDTLVADGDGTFTLTKRDRTAYDFDGSGRLLAILDKNGNRIGLTYSGANLAEITDTAGRIVNLDYDGSGRLVLMTDPIGRTVRYAYDTQGNLIEATDPNGNLTRYTYDDRHQILTVVDPRGHTIVNNTYDADRRVVTYQTDAKGNPTSYIYQELDRVTTITDALDGVTVHHHDELLRLVQEEDPRGGTRLYEYDAAGNRVAVTEPMGHTTRYGYDARGNVIRKTDALGNITKITYDADDNPLSRTDAHGKVTRFDYDARGNLTKTSDPLDQVTEIAYLPNGLPETITDPRRNVTTNAYDAEGNLIRVTNALSQTTDYTYDGVGRRRSETDALVRTTQYGYDENDNLRTITDADGRIITHTYDENDNKTSTTDRNGNLTLWAYDEKDLLIRETDAMGQSGTSTYDALDRRLTRTDRRGFTTHFAYDATGNLVEVIDPLGHKTRYTYDLNGNRLSETNARDHTIEYQYDALNRRTRVLDPLNNALITAYDALGRITTLTAPGGRVTEHTYDALGQLKEVKDAEGGETRYTYDANGNQTSVTDPAGHTTQSVYDELNRLREARDPFGKKTLIAYDTVGNLARVTDPLGHATTFTYDRINRLKTQTDAEDHTTLTDYDPGGRVIAVTDPNQRTTRFEYDKLDRLILVTDAANGTVRYGYDENGNRIRMTDPNENLTRYVYDELNRRIRMTEPLGSLTVFEYDPVGNLRRKTDPKGQVIQYSYDERNLRTGIDYPAQSDVGFTYDEVGNLRTLTDGLGTTTHVYDKLNRRTGTTDPYGQLVGYGYDANGNRETLTYPGGKTVTYDYDAANRMTRVNDWLGQLTAYSYDDAGRLTGTANANGTTTTYAYDDADRLTALTNATSDGIVINAYAYTLDPVGNHLSEERTEPLSPLLTAETVTDTHDAENRLTASNGVLNSFDANGNLTAKGSDTFVYDAVDRLIETNMSGIQAQYRYDAFGNRYSRTRAGAETRFVLDTNTALTNVLMEADGVGIPLAYNVYGQGLISRIQADGSVWQYHYDSRGSTISITDAAQNVVQQYAYDPFGRVSNRSGSGGNPFGFLGRHGVVDEGDDLSYIRARYYNAEQQRFVNKDAEFGRARVSQSLNLYIYSLNSVTRLIDISGFTAKDAVATVKTRNDASGVNLLTKGLFSDLNAFDLMVAFAYQGNKAVYTGTAVSEDDSDEKRNGKSGGLFNMVITFLKAAPDIADAFLRGLGAKAGPTPSGAMADVGFQSVEVGIEFLDASIETRKLQERRVQEYVDLLKDGYTIDEVVKYARLDSGYGVGRNDKALRDFILIEAEKQGVDVRRE